jgi:hypothetical protein
VLSVPSSTDQTVNDRRVKEKQLWKEQSKVLQEAFKARGGLDGKANYVQPVTGFKLGGVPINAQPKITQTKDTYNITVNGTQLTGEQIAAAIKKYNRQRGKTGTGGFVDLG